MARLSDAGYKERMRHMINDLSNEERGKRLLNQLVRNRQQEEIMREMITASTLLEEKASQLEERTAQLQNQLKYGHLSSYRIRYRQCTPADPDRDDLDFHEEVNEEDFQDMSALVYFHRYMPNACILTFIDDSFQERHCSQVLCVTDC